MELLESLSLVTFIWNHLQKYFLQIEGHIEEQLVGSSVKPSQSEVSLSKNVPGVPDILSFPFLLCKYDGPYNQMKIVKR